MSGAGLRIALDLLVAVVATATWLGAGAATAAGRSRVAGALLAAAVAATLARVGTVVALAGSGWWFVQEKVAFTLPLLLVAGAVAALTRAVVPLLVAGYAAAGGLAVTFLVGYPVTWSVALVTLALVGLAGLVTWRALAPGRSPARRRIGAVLAGVGAVGAGVAFVPGPGMDRGGGPDGAATTAVPVSTLRGPAEPAPGGEVRRFALTARQASVTLPSGRSVDAWTYNGQVPGPAITATEGDLLEVTLRNDDIPDGVTLHWHGYEVPSGEDGVPGLTQGVVAAGEEFTYRFRADQVGTYWYHTHQASHRGVRKGLYGTLVVTPTEEEPSGVDLTVPVHTFGSTTVFGEACEPNQDRCGAGDEPRSDRVAQGTPVRLRLVNTDSTPHRFTLAGAAYRIAAVDGRDLHRPGEVREVSLRLPAGGRYDLVFTMPDSPVTLASGSAGLHLLPDDGTVTTPDPAGWPELDLLSYGAADGTTLGGEFDRDFTLVLDRGLAMVDGAPAYAHTVNGRAYPSIPMQHVAEGDLVRFTVVNRSLETHPWHLHGHTVLVLSRDGREPSGSPLWLDTFDVRPGEVWQVGFRADNPGLWMNHCHNLPHAEQGMMLHLGYEGVTAG